MAKTLREVVVTLDDKQPTAGGGSGSSVSKANKHIYSEYELAALQGFCGVTEI